MAERVGLAAAAALIGWLVGAASARATAWLERSDPADAGDELAVVDKTARIRARGWPVIVDPLVQSACAAVWAAAALFVGGELAHWTAAAMLAVPLVQVAVTDYRTRYVYTLYAAAGIVLGLALSWQFHGGAWWTGLAGALGGYVSFGLLYWLGRLLFRREAMARGDLSIAAMVGAGAATCTPLALFWGVLIGGVLGVLTLLVRRQLGTYMPYGPGLCLGGLVALFLC